MQFVSFSHNSRPGVGVVVGDTIHPLEAAGMIEVIETIEAIRAGQDTLAPGLALSEVELLPAVPNPGKIVCLGLNYLEHAKEGGRTPPEHPTLFLRTTTSLAAANEDIAVPAVSHKLDYEAELAVIIGKTGRNISQADAADHIFGYTAFNDISVRDYQSRTLQWASGKNFDRTGPLGPVIVTADELPPFASGLSIRTVLNGEVMQDGNTADMIFDLPRIIADVSEIMTLHPGDVIVTGTPSGVGFARKPPVWMKAGDVVRIEIEGIPTLENRITA
ncbi:fumarylacetoacetate hydrolase family protein [Pelagibacterium lacus]|uniref:FAA hydrolase family protein n=1 Tax=Pelagibacterium lacus TaxID=2282655 RepID=A0A369W2K8_9HYPH|nr:fumarylacetoacetate hydrolase family protein [Pelagibacterium lacus]RDE08105.1 FAA hydrolase family protein [Pelagibacterium lacus]